MTPFDNPVANMLVLLTLIFLLLAHGTHANPNPKPGPNPQMVWMVSDPLTDSAAASCRGRYRSILS